MLFRMRSNGSVLTEREYTKIIHPGTMFPSVITAACIQQDDAEPIVETPIPEYDPRTQSCVEGPIVLVNGQLATTWNVTELSGEEINSKLIAGKADLINFIDKSTDAIYNAVIGSRGAEYTTASAEATEFANGGYQGIVPHSVSSWRDAKNIANAGREGWIDWTDQQATDDILATAQAWVGAQQAIRSMRLVTKEKARIASNELALSTLLAQWEGFVAYIRSQLGA